MDRRGGGGPVRGGRGGPVPVHYRWPAGCRGSDRPVPGAARRRPGCKDNYAVSVSRIMSSLSAYRVIMAAAVGIFMLSWVGNVVTRRPALQDPVSRSGRMLLTVTGMRRRHGHATGRTGSERGRAGGGALPES